MHQWYLTKVRYVKQFEDGKLKSVNEPYLFDAVGFSDCEARVYEEIAPSIRGEFIIEAISKKDYADIFLYDDADIWYEAKVEYVTVDADSGREKKVTQKFLVTAHTAKEAYVRMEESLEGMMVSYSIPAVVETPIVDIFPAIMEEKEGDPETSSAEQLGVDVNETADEVQ